MTELLKELTTFCKNKGLEEREAAYLLGLFTKHNEALRQPPVSGSLLSDVDYWKQRCLLAEQCLEESPCDPDITCDQIKAWNAYHNFISWAGNDR